MIRVGITGQPVLWGPIFIICWEPCLRSLSGFPGKTPFFADPAGLREFVRSCDAIVHLAAMNRHPDPGVIYDTNVRLVRRD